jgi:hypothetical protein
MDLLLKGTFMFYFIVACLLIIAGLVCLVSSSYISEPNLVKMLLDQVASVLVITGLFSLIQKYFTDRNLFKTIREMFKVHESMYETGLAEVYSESQAYNFTDMIEESKILRIILNDGNRWLTNNIVAMKERFSNKFETELYTVDPENDFSISLAAKTNTHKEELDRKIKDTWGKIIQTWEESPKKGSLKIFKLRHYPTYSAFLNESTAIVSLYQISAGRSNVPTLIAKGIGTRNSFYSFVLHDFEEIQKEAILYFDSEKGGAHH